MMKYSGEWEALDNRYKPFPSKKALKEYVAAGGDVRLEDLTFFGGHGQLRGFELAEGDEVYVIYGPNPSRNVPNKWYANLKRKGGKLIVT